MSTDGAGLSDGLVVELSPAHPGETWLWPTDCTRCNGLIGPWDPRQVGSSMTHIVAGGGPDWAANNDHDPEA